MTPRSQQNSLNAVFSPPIPVPAIAGALESVCGDAYARDGGLLFRAG
eukprot:CAMPEP_0175348340 /NCGR_PEP_ID=MMETSP0095-20121207/9839_1 /TAXON_ID=311494 /ORGANISM="Alexandrium monilatum, Strain CCMP3105" /LENGTH=46 /DNA_ID= /DNA_START= /DNA_END= /DNA_ORIENTATION=